MGAAALAGRYAEALYRAAKDAGREMEVLEKLVELKGTLDQDPEAWGRILDPRAGIEKKEEYLAQRFLIDRDRLVGNTIRLLLRKRRVHVLKDFFRVYLEVHEREEGVLRVSIETASPLTQAEQVVLWERLETSTGKTVIVEPRVEPSLLGGMRLIVGSKVVDGTLRSRLDRLKKDLKGAHVGG